MITQRFPDTGERGFNLQSVSGLHNNSPVIINVLKSLHSAMVLTVVTSTICFQWFLLAFFEIPTAWLSFQ